eukprot:g1198.t1
MLARAQFSERRPNQNVEEDRAGGDVVRIEEKARPRQEIRAQASSRRSVLLKIMDAENSHNDGVYLQARATGTGDKITYHISCKNRFISEAHKLNIVASADLSRFPRKNDVVFAQPKEHGPWYLCTVNRRIGFASCDVKSFNDTIYFCVPKERLAFVDSSVKVPSRVHQSSDRPETDDDDGSGATTKRARSIPVRSRKSYGEKRKKKPRKKKRAAARKTGREKVPSETKKVLDDVHETETEILRISTDSSRFHSTNLASSKTNTGAVQSPRTVARLRRKVQRQRMREQNEAASMVQALARGKLSRRRTDALRSQYNEAASRIQANFKGHVVRKRDSIDALGTAISNLGPPFRALVYECVETRVTELLIEFDSSKLAKKEYPISVTEITTHPSLINFVQNGRSRAFKEIIVTEAKRHCADRVVIAVHQSAVPASPFLSARCQAFLKSCVPKKNVQNRSCLFEYVVVNSDSISRNSVIGTMYAARWHGVPSVRSILRTDSGSATLTLFSQISIDKENQDQKVRTVNLLLPGVEDSAGSEKRPSLSSGDQILASVRRAGLSKQPARGSLLLIGSEGRTCLRVLRRGNGRNGTIKRMSVGTASLALTSAARRLDSSNPLLAGILRKQSTILQSVAKDDELIRCDLDIEPRQSSWCVGWFINACVQRMQEIDDDGRRALSVGDAVEHLRDLSSETRCDNNDARALNVGDEIKCKYRGGKKYFRGSIVKVHRTEDQDARPVYDVRYVDGDNESRVPRNLIKLVKSAPDTSAKGNGRLVWCTGSIVGVHSGSGVYDLVYDDEKRSRAVNVPRASLRMLNTRFRPQPKSGDEIALRRDGMSDQWIEARVITRAEDDGLTDAVLDSGETIRDLPRALIRSLSVDGATDTFLVGDDVEARFRGGNEYIAGTIAVVWRDGSYDVKYDTGAVETHVRRSLVRRLRNVETSTLHEGDNVEFRKDGRSSFLPAVVRSKNKDGTYDLTLSLDGSKVRNVRSQLIRSVAAHEARAATRIQAVYRSTASRKRAILARRNMRANISDLSKVETAEVGPIDKIELAGDRVEEEPTRAEVRKEKDVSSPSAESQAVTATTTSEDNDKGRDEMILSLFRAGDVDGDSVWNLKEANRIQALQGDDTIDETSWRDICTQLNCDPSRGLSLEAVKMLFAQANAKDVQKLIDAAVAAAAAATAAAVAHKTKAAREARDKSFGVGDFVECRYAGKKKYFVAMIEKIQRDDDGESVTYDVVYVDGDRERNVKSNCVRPFVPFEVDAHVEARFGGKKRYFAGRILAVDRKMWTYSVKYEDGDEETGVLHRYVRFPRK